MACFCFVCITAFSVSPVLLALPHPEKICGHRKFQSSFFSLASIKWSCFGKFISCWDLEDSNLVWLRTGAPLWEANVYFFDYRHCGYGMVTGASKTCFIPDRHRGLSAKAHQNCMKREVCIKWMLFFKVHTWILDKTHSYLFLLQLLALIIKLWFWEKREDFVSIPDKL